MWMVVQAAIEIQCKLLVWAYMYSLIVCVSDRNSVYCTCMSAIELLAVG